MQIEKQRRHGLGEMTLREYIMQQQAQRAEYAPEKQKARFYAWTAGHFPRDLAERQRREFESIYSRASPIIPAWLGNNPPLQAVFVPNGEILTLGPLGLRLIEDKQQGPVMYSQHLGEEWYRYSPEGQLLGQYKLGTEQWRSDWWNIYADWNWLEGELSASKHKFSNQQAPNGYRVYIDQEQVSDDPYTGWVVKRIIAAYDWQGNMVDPDVPVKLDRHIYPLQQQQLVAQYKQQVEQGLTDPAAVSPFTGRPDGPVVVDSTPRPPKKVATRYRNVQNTDGTYRPSQQEWLVIRALDDPDNPYAGKYGPWDQWILDNSGKRNPREDAFNQEQWKRINAEQEKARKEGKKSDAMALSYRQYQPPPDDLWQNFYMQVDEQGSMLPLIEMRKKNASQSRDLREQQPMNTQPDSYSFHAGGEMPAELRRQLAAALAREIPSSVPPALPQWLESQPVFGFIAMPNGDWVTRGPLGSWQPRPADPQPLEGSADITPNPANNAWHRFSPQGDLLGKVLDPTPWLQLYSPQLATLQLSGQSQGYEAHAEGRYLIWRQKRELGGKVIAAWDYDGTPMSLDQPLLYNASEMRYWSWEDLQKTREGQLNYYY